MNSFVKLRPAVANSYRHLATVNKESIRNMHIKPIKMWWRTGDNYAYLVTDETTKDSVIIDPAHPKDVLPTLSPLVKSGDVNLTAIMNTHKHHDHSGGNDELLSTLKSIDGKDLPLIAGSGSPRVTRTPKHGESFSFGSVSVKALHTPCHTDESICWHFTDSSSGNEAGKTNNAVFTGDTLFSGGCGRFFEGTPEQMDTALNKTLAALPDDTRIYPGHEYTKSNAKFAVSVSSKPEIKELLDYATTNEVTTGRWTMGEEKKHNVFMMLQDEEIRKKTGTEGKNEASVMGKLREMKNSFRG